MKRIALVVISGIALIILSLTLQGAAWGGGTGPSTPAVTFDNSAQAVQLTIPPSACTSGPNCQWKFYLTEPTHSLVVGSIDGSSGTLTIPYPASYCGSMEAEAYVGQSSSPAVQDTMNACCWPTSSTTMPSTWTSTSTTSTTMPALVPTPTPAPTTTTTTTSTSLPNGNGADSSASPPSAAAASPPAAGSVAANSVTPPANASAAVPATVPATAGPTSLPFTGLDIKALFFAGLALVALGLTMLVRRRSGAR
jgi:hypothetical protein